MGAFLRRAIGWMIGHPALAGLVVFTLLVQLVRKVSAAFLYGIIFDQGIGEGDGHALAWALGALAALLAAFTVASFTQEAAMSRLALKITNRLRERIFGKVLSVPPSFHDRNSPSDLVDRMGGDVGAVELALVRGVPVFLLNVSVVVVAILLLLVIEWRLALLVLALVPISMLASKPFQGRAAARMNDANSANAELLTLTQQAAAGYLPVMIFRAQAQFVRRFAQRLGVFGRLSSGGHFHSAATGRAIEIVTGITELLIIGVGAWFVYRGEMTIGLLIAFASLLMNMSEGVGRISEALPLVTRGADGASRIEALLASAETIEDPPDARALESFQDSIVFDQVSFGYDGTPTLRAVSFSIPAGSVVALVGPSGSGKSTVLSLLMRLRAPDAGEICIDDMPIGKVSEDSLRHLIGAVPQMPSLFSGSVRDNIAIARPGADDDEIRAAAATAGAHEFISSLPDGYATEVGDGGGQLSGGQRQRIALARTFLRDAPILLFDEPTSALDVSSEAVVNKSIAELRGRRTALVVTHRVADLSAFDRVLVFDQGRLIQDGTHDELAGQPGVYRDLRAQVQGLNAEDEADAAITPERLAEFPFLEGCAATTLETMAGQFLADWVAEDREVFREGDLGRRFYVIARGTVEVLRERPDGTQEQLATMRDGECFGELALLSDAPRIATIRTLTDCQFLTLHRKQFLELMDADPVLRANMDAMAAERT